MVPGPGGRILQRLQISGAAQAIERLGRIEIQIFRVSRDRDIAPGFQESRNAHALDDVLLVVPLVEVPLLGRIGVHQRDEHSFARKRHGRLSLGLYGWSSRPSERGEREPGSMNTNLRVT